MIVQRTVRKISDDTPIEDIVNVIANMLGIDPSEVQLSDDIVDYLRRQQKEKLEIEKIINPFYNKLKSQNTKDSNKKLNELIDLGKFIYFSELQSEIEIIDCDEQPDFIIKYNNEFVGIEHTGIYDEQVVAEIKTFKKIIGKCQEILRSNYTGITGLFNIVVIPIKLKGILHIKESVIIQNICEFIIAKHNNSEFIKPEFIADIIYTPHQIVDLTLGEDYWLADLSPNKIAKTISKKETKIEAYKLQKDLAKFWLLIVIDGVSSASSFKISLDILPKQSTQFDRIFIFDNFKGTIIQGELT